MYYLEIMDTLPTTTPHRERPSLACKAGVLLVGMALAGCYTGCGGAQESTQDGTDGLPTSASSAASSASSGDSDTDGPQTSTATATATSTSGETSSSGSTSESGGETDTDTGDEPICEECDGVAWQPMRLDFPGPQASELDSQPNPFLDIRLVVTFSGPSGQKLQIPGFFAGDGVGGESGNVWSVWFTPEEEGDWSYEVSLEEGAQLAIADPGQGGSPTRGDGESGDLQIAPPQPSAPGTLGKGRLEAVGEHYLRWQDGSYWLKGGADSPENFLAYSGFDATTYSRLHLHDYDAHVGGWQPGDPDWGDDKGRGIIGALNYLESVHVNSVYALLMNIGGDGQDVWPYAGNIDPKGGGANDNLHFDISKLEQWELVFDHAQRAGIVLHLVLNEAEAANKLELDGGELGAERRLYYREMIARFAHHNGLQWNISEEYDLDFNLGPQRVMQFAEYIQAVDPYDHPITVHNAMGLESGWQGFAGFAPITLTSFQIQNRSVESIIETWREWSAATGNPWVISVDEFTVDAEGQGAPWEPVYVPNQYRRLKTWPIYLSGGQLEFILPGYLAVDNFADFDQLWLETWYARDFVERLPFAKMEPMDNLLSGAATYSNGRSQGSIGGQVLAKPGEAYAVYLPAAQGGAQLDLMAAPGEYSLRWYDPRQGQFVGEPLDVSGGQMLALGAPPAQAGEDWAVAIEVK